MGSYHSYVGDAKLEDSKDNWYRISGMNISRWNIEPTYGVWNAIRKNPLKELQNNDIGYLANDKSLWSFCYAKILNYTSNYLRSYNTWVRIVPCGNGFDIKDRPKFDATAIMSTDKPEIAKGFYVTTGVETNKYYLTCFATQISSANNLTMNAVNPNETTPLFRPMLTLKPVDPGITNPIIFSGKVRSKCIIRPYGWDRTSQLITSYSAYNIKSIELALNVDLRGNPLANNAKYTNEVLAGRVPPKAEENICIEYKTYEQKASDNAYQLKVTFDNGKILYVFDALAGTGISYANQDNTQPRIYRLSDLV